SIPRSSPAPVCCDWPAAFFGSQQVVNRYLEQPKKATRRWPSKALPRSLQRFRRRFRRLIVAAAPAAGEAGRQGLAMVVKTFALAGDLQHRVALEGSRHQVATKGHLGV